MMIKLLFLLFFFIVILSCSSAKKSTQNNDVKINLTDEDRNGIEFIKKEDCFTCHSIDRALVGPSFHDIAGKYEPIERNLMRLSKKIIEGGNGNWGKLFMIPHSNLSQTEAEAIVKYIYSLLKSKACKKILRLPLPLSS